MPLKETLYTFISHDFYSPSVTWLLNIIHKGSKASPVSSSNWEAAHSLKGVGEAGGGGSESSD